LAPPTFDQEPQQAEREVADFRPQQILQERPLAIGGQPWVAQGLPQVWARLNDLAEPEELVFDLIELTLRLGHGEQRLGVSTDEAFLRFHGRSLPLASPPAPRAVSVARRRDLLELSDVVVDQPELPVAVEAFPDHPSG